MTFTLRVPVEVLGDPIAGVNKSAPLRIGGFAIGVVWSRPLLVVSADGFATESDAREFLPRVIAALWSLTVRFNIAFRSHFVPLVIENTSDPIAAGNNLAGSFGVDSGPAIDAIVDVTDTVVYKTGSRLTWLTGHSATLRVATPVETVIASFGEAINRAESAELVADLRFRTAVELFGEYFYETSLRAKVLTLATVLEILAPNRKKHAVAQDLITQFKQRIRQTLDDSSDPDARHALESIDRELDFRRETSIRQRIRYLIRDEFAHLAADRRLALERDTVRAYDLRGSLIHTGNVADAHLDSAHVTMRTVIQGILGSRLGVHIH